MHLPSSLLFLASLGLAAANNSQGNDNNQGNDNDNGKGNSNKGLDVLARKAGLKYFGSATDSPGQRERAGYESVYPQYDQIMWDSGEFGQTTPTNGQKVALVRFFVIASNTR
jgi:endo-1,4-beta-xylanase